MYRWRELESPLLSALQRHNILLRGPRQAGKTTLIRHIMESTEGVYYTMDNPTHREIFENFPDDLVTANVVFIDEIQESPNAGRILRYLLDKYKTTRFVITGSGGFDLKLRLSSYLVGRVVEFVLLPLSFREYVKWNDEELFRFYDRARTRFLEFLEGKNNLPLKLPHLQQLELLMKGYMKFGGYPQVVLSDEKELVLANLIKFVVEKDIFNFFDIREKNKFFSLFKLLANRNGQLIHLSKLNVDYKTAIQYLNILEENFIIKLLPPYVKNPEVEIRKAKKLLFYDAGFFAHFSKLSYGFSLEQFVFRQLLPEYYWRDKYGHEVDFVRGNIPIEVKTKDRLNRGFFRFLDTYEPEIAIVISQNWTPKIEKYKKSTIVHWPAFYL